MHDIATTAPTDTSEKLVVNLWREPDGRLFARSVEIVDRISSVRFSFNSDCMIDRIFDRRALSEICGIVARVASPRGVLMLPDLRIDLKGLVLEGCRVLVTTAEDGIETIMVRFTSYFGRVLSLFRDGFQQRSGLSENAVDQAISALEKVYMPLRKFSVYLDDLLATFPHLLDRDKIASLRRIRADVAEMGHISDLIVHYVNSKGAVEDSEIADAPLRVDPPALRTLAEPDDLADFAVPETRSATLPA